MRTIFAEYNPDETALMFIPVRLYASQMTAGKQKRI